MKTLLEKYPILRHNISGITCKHVHSSNDTCAVVVSVQGSVGTVIILDLDNTVTDFVVTRALIISGEYPHSQKPFVELESTSLDEIFDEHLPQDALFINEILLAITHIPNKIMVHTEQCRVAWDTPKGCLEIWTIPYHSLLSVSLGDITLTEVDLFDTEQHESIARLVNLLLSHVT